MAIITISTVGFGEIHALSAAGRIFTSFLIVGGLGTAVYTFTRLGQVVLEGELLGGLGRRRMRKELRSSKDTTFSAVSEEPRGPSRKASRIKAALLHRSG